MTKQIVYKDISEIKPYRNNVKLHPQSQIDLIIKSIELAGFDQPIVIDQKGTIIKGHGRYLASKQMGLKQVPVVISDVDKDTAKSIRILDNETTKTGYDMELLLKELETMTSQQQLDTGIDEQELSKLLKQLETDIDLMALPPLSFAPTSIESIADDLPPVTSSRRIDVAMFDDIDIDQKLKKQDKEEATVLVLGPVRFEIPLSIFTPWFTSLRQEVGADSDSIQQEIKRRLGLCN